MEIHNLTNLCALIVCALIICALIVCALIICALIVCALIVCALIVCALSTRRIATIYDHKHPESLTLLFDLHVVYLTTPNWVFDRLLDVRP